MKKLYILTIVFLITTACTTNEKEEQIKLEETSLAVGSWRGEMEISGSKSPFNFEVKKNDNQELNVYLLNAEERFLLNNVYIKDDSVVVAIDVYDALLIGKVVDNTWKGYFRRNEEGTNDVPFSAVHNERYRFSNKIPQSFESVAGRWAIQLIDEKGKVRDAIGVFEQENHELTGTILGRTGDYRFFEGMVIKDSLFLSAFSGASPYLIQGKLINDSIFEGNLVTSSSVFTMKGVRNDSLTPENLYELTHVDNEEGIITFSLPDIDGNIVSLNDERFKNKVVIIPIMGTWCPNCIDEAAFLVPWYEQNKDRGVEIVAVSFERKDDFDYARTRLNKFIDRLDVSYPVLFGGLADKQNVYDKLKGINGVISYPTTIFIGKDGKVHKIHTGFFGPAAKEYYDDFVISFNTQIDLMLEE